MNERRSVNGGERGLDPGIAMDSKFQSAVVSYEGLPLKSIQPYRTRDEFLVAMREDLAEWFNGLYHLDMEESTLFQHLSNGVILCQHANTFNEAMICSRNNQTSGRDFAFTGSTEDLASSPVQCHRAAQPGTFHSRVNIANFLSWCRGTVGLRDTLLFETEDLVQGRNERNVVLCLLEVARRGGRVGMPVPTLVQLEAEIDEEIRLGDGSSGTKDVGVQTPPDGVDLVPGTGFFSSESGWSGESASRQHPTPSRTQRQSSVTSSVHNRRSKPVVEVDFLSLDEMVRKLLGRCTCEAQYPMVRVSEGKYRIGESLVYIFVRILRNHVMVRIGGGWDTLENYLHRHDPCRMEVKAPRHAPRQSHCSSHPSQTSSTSSAPSSIIPDSAVEEGEDSDGTTSDDTFQQDASGSLTGRHLLPRHCSIDRTGDPVAVQSKTGRRRAFSSADEGHQDPVAVAADMGSARVASSGKAVADFACQATALELARSCSSSSSSGTASLEPTTDRFEADGHKIQTHADETHHPSVNIERGTLKNVEVISDTTEGNNNRNATTNETRCLDVVTPHTTTAATKTTTTTATNPQKKNSSCQADGVRPNAFRMLPRICRICEKPFSAANETRTSELCPTCSKLNAGHRPPSAPDKTSEIPRPRKSLPVRPGSTPDRRSSTNYKEKIRRNDMHGADVITLDVCREFAAAGPAVNQPGTSSAHFVELKRQSKQRRPASAMEIRPQNVTNNNPCILHHPPPPPSNAQPRNARPGSQQPHRLQRPSSALEQRHAAAHRQGDRQRDRQGGPRAGRSRQTVPAIISPPENHFTHELRSISMQRKSTRTEDFLKEDDDRRRKPGTAIISPSRNFLTRQPNVLSPQNSYSEEVTEISEGIQTPSDEKDWLIKTRMRKETHKQSSVTKIPMPMPSRIT